MFHMGSTYMMAAGGERGKAKHCFSAKDTSLIGSDAYTVNYVKDESPSRAT